MPFSIPLSLSQIGGVPTALQLHLALSHTPLGVDDRGYVKVLVNNTLVRSFEFRPEGNARRLLDSDRRRSDSRIQRPAVVPTYFYKHRHARARIRA